MGTMINNGNDVVAFLKEQHRQVNSLFAEIDSAHGEERAQAFYALRRMLAVHETAEEEIVHPTARRVLPDGDAVVALRLKEENEAKKALTEIEKLDVDSSEFEQQFKILRSKVAAHAESEERDEFERLRSRFDASRLERMRTAVEFAEAVAPTRPHPGVESATANMLAGPFAAMLDRSRDALSGKKAGKSPS
jgi:hemerythrin superfamily protein